MTGAELASLLKGQLKSSMGFAGMAGQDAPELHLSEKQTRWWQDARLGLFIHWGVYSVVGKGEWAYFNEKIPEDAYRKIAEEEFRPNRTPREIMEEWLTLAQDAGMKYSVMVTRHHDGFAMWDSKHSWKNFTSAACGPKTDYVRTYMEVCREKGIHAGLYYSPMDWRFPGYFDPKEKPENAALMKEQAYRQIEELCRDYGKVEVLWYDGGWLAHEGTDADAAWFWEPLKLNRMVRTYQPDALISPRSGYRGDFECDEGPHEITGSIVPLLWEKSMSVTGAWGYRPQDTVFDSAYLIRMLADVICRGGNLLLNIGPDRDGRVPEQVRESLKGLGCWVRKNAEAVYGTRAGFWEPRDRVFGSVQKKNAVYLYILDPAAFENVVLPCPEGKNLKRAQLLDGTTVEVRGEKGGLRFKLPEKTKSPEDPVAVVKLTFGQNRI